MDARPEPPLPRPAPDTAPSRRRTGIWLALVLVAVTGAVYARVVTHDFIPYDDDLHVTTNAHVRTGLSLANLEWAFRTTDNGYWMPLTWLSHQVDMQVFGLDAGGHHAVSVLLHLANTLLVLVVLTRATRRLWPSAVVAGLFALHPLHVESVAWVFERKDVLSTWFALSALWAYLRFVERPSTARYLAVLGLFGLALMSKPMVVTLPVLMLLLDAWPLDRLRTAPGRRRALLEKVPLLLVAAACGIVTLLATREIGAMAPTDPAAWIVRLDNALASYVAYLGKAAWPAGLAVFYPYPGGDVDALRLTVHALVLLGLTGALLVLGRRRGYLAVGWLWYLVALLPVIGLVQVGAQAMADRYTYVALLGPFVVLAFGAADLVRAGHVRTLVPAAAAVAVLLACAVCTFVQLGHWKSGATLFAHALDVTSDNYFMRMKYATLLSEEGRAAAALPHFEEALRLQPGNADIHVNYGTALTALGRHDEALRHYERAVALDPGSALAHYNLGVARAARADDATAIRHYETAVRLRPDYEEAWCNLGCVLLRAGEPERALPHLERALALRPEDVVARRAYAPALARAGRPAEAIAQYERLLSAGSDDARLLTEFGDLLHARGAVGRAVACWRRALQADPDHAEARERLEAAGRGGSR